MKKICAGLALLVLLPCWALAQGLAMPDDGGAPRLGVVPDPGGDFEMALRYFSGEGVPRDNVRGLTFLRQAAALGFAAPAEASAAQPKSVWLDSPNDSATIQIFASSSLAEARAVAGRHPYKRSLAATDGGCPGADPDDHPAATGEALK